MLRLYLQPFHNGKKTINISIIFSRCSAKYIILFLADFITIHLGFKYIFIRRINLSFKAISPLYETMYRFIDTYELQNNIFVIIFNVNSPFLSLSYNFLNSIVRFFIQNSVPNSYLAISFHQVLS